MIGGAQGITCVVLAMLIACAWMRPEKVVHVDLIELNKVVREDGSGFYQIILWEWNAEYRRHDVTDWWIVDDPYVQSTITRCGGVHEVTHGKQKIRSTQFRHTVTPTDREIDHRRLRPENTRARRL